MKMNTTPPPPYVYGLLDYDATEGVFRWLIARGSRAKVGALAGHKDRTDGYVTLCFERRHYKAHRLAWWMYYGEWPDFDIDHINGDRADNRISNLRRATRTLNNQNQKKARSDNTHGYLGVSFSRRALVRPWRAAIHLDGQRKHIGCYDTPEEAHAAYLEAKRRLHEGCTI